MGKNSQTEYFVQEGADAWYERNKQALKNKSSTDSVLIETIAKLPFTPEKVLDIGCSSGEKLKLIQDMYQCECYGIEPSSKAVLDGNTREDCKLQLTVGTADSLPYNDESFDTIILSSVLLWCARNKLFTIASEVDRVLKTGGTIIIADFDSKIPFKNTFIHSDKEVWTYKMEYEKMFTWHSQYVVASKISYDAKKLTFSEIPNERRSVTAIIKIAEHESMATNIWK